MPNWCATNWKVRGKAADIQNLADVFNSLKDRENVMPNGFGKNWLGNLAVALGYDYEFHPNSKNKGGLNEYENGWDTSIAEDTQFITLELGLYLDTHPEDAEAFQLYQRYVQLLEQGRRTFVEQIGPLEQIDAAMDDSYTWVNAPWPWQQNTEG